MPRQRKGKTRSGRKIKLTDRSTEILEAQLAAFRKKFGRDPEGNDPVFFDPNADEPRPIDNAHFHSVMMETLAGIGAPPQIIYAYARTGLLVTASNKDIIPDDDMAEWDAAIDEYFELEDAAAGGEHRN